MGTDGGDAVHIHRRQRGAYRGRGCAAARGLGVAACAVAGQTGQHLIHKGRALRRAVKQYQLLPRAGHGHVKQPPVLLILLCLAGRAAAQLRLGGQNAVQHIQQNDPVIFQPLGRVDRRKQKPAPGRIFMVLYDAAQLFQPPQQVSRRRLLCAEHFQHSQFRAVHAVFVQIFAVAQLVGQEPHRIVRGHFGQTRQTVRHVSHGGAGAWTDAVLIQQGRPATLPVLPRLIAGKQRLCAGDGHAEFVVAAQKSFPIRGVCGQRENIGHIADDLVGKKGLVHCLAGVGDAPPLAQVDDGQCALVVAEQHRRPGIAVLRRLKQEWQLVGATWHGDDLQRCAGALRRCDGLGAAIAVARHKAVGSLQNRLCGAVVLLHQQNLCAGIGLFKVHQRLGVGGAEAVNALVLVADHKDIAAFLRQHADNFMLHLGRILRLIDAEILVPLAERRRNRGRTAQDLQRKAELVVVVHFVRGLQRLLVAAVQVGQVLNVGFQLVQFRVGQAHIFNVGDGRAQILDRALGGVLVVCVLP